MKKLLMAATAAMLVTASVAQADDAPTPQMPVEIVTQDSLMIGEEQAGMIVPIMTMILLLLIATGGSGTPIDCFRGGC